MALVTKTRSPQTIGLECARPGIDVRHRMLSPVVPFHRSGRCWPSATPAAAGPRNDGQLPSLDEGAGSACAGLLLVRTIFRADMARASLSATHVLSWRIMRRGSHPSWI